MKIFLNILGSLLLATMLFGCSTKTETVTVSDVDVVTIDLPSELTSNCEITTPPDADIYLSMDYEGKEDMLTGYIISLIKDLKNCNLQITAIRDTISSHKEIYQTKSEGN